MKLCHYVIKVGFPFLTSSMKQKSYRLGQFLTGLEICTTYYYIISNHSYSLILLGGDHRNRGHPGNNTTPEDPSNPDEMVSSNDRLLQLIIKGILYESCVDFCQQKATGAKHADHIKFTNLLSQSDFRLGSICLHLWRAGVTAN